MKRIQTCFGSVAFCWLLFTFNSHAATHYVDANGTNPVMPYTDWGTAATNIQDAIDASTDGDLVLVTNGVYVTGGRTVNGHGITNRIVIDKAVAVRSVNGTGVTTIQGNSPVGVNAVRCVYLTNNAALIGFTLTNGATLDTGDYYYDKSGGGVLCESHTTTISGHQVAPSVTAIISNCVFVANSAGNSALGGSGGGVEGGTLYNCLFNGNNASVEGGGADAGVLNGCVFITNQASYWGGGGAAFSILNNCSLIGNSALVDAQSGGADNCELTNCVIIGNSAAYGGGSSASTVVNSLLSGNSADYGGGADACELINCTVVGNSSSTEGGGVEYSTALNSIVYYNTSLNGANFDVGSDLNQCCVMSYPSGGLNFTNAPLFVAFNSGNFHLQSNSPCINSGNNVYVTMPQDLDGNPRITGGTVDIGAYEYQSPSSTLSYAWAQQYGLPTDGTADNADTDGDGMNNYAEWKAGTDPTNALSLLKLESPDFTNSPSGIVVTWQSVANVTYYLQRSSDLSAEFSAIQSNLVGQAGFTRYTDTSATNEGPYFYRVGVQ